MQTETNANATAQAQTEQPGTTQTGTPPSQEDVTTRRDSPQNGQKGLLIIVGIVGIGFLGLIIAMICVMNAVSKAGKTDLTPITQALEKNQASQEKALNATADKIDASTKAMAKEIVAGVIQSNTELGKQVITATSKACADQQQAAQANANTLAGAISNSLAVAIADLKAFIPQPAPIVAAPPVVEAPVVPAPAAPVTASGVSAQQLVTSSTWSITPGAAGPRFVKGIPATLALPLPGGTYAIWRFVPSGTPRFACYHLKKNGEIEWDLDRTGKPGLPCGHGGVLMELDSKVDEGRLIEITDKVPWATN